MRLLKTPRRRESLFGQIAKTCPKSEGAMTNHSVVENPAFAGMTNRNKNGIAESTIELQPLPVRRADQLLPIPDHASVDPGGTDARLERGAFERRPAAFRQHVL